ncbi:MAG: preprotein translocase subunit YajC [Micropruina sp.]|uniref:preprotein translocase subunit YajC n=1 Tax=Micropruina sp. TaxID=2737536 RepID=UPI0039E375E5
MGDMGSTVLMLVLMGAAFYFLLIRPQQKRAKQQQEMTNSLQPGTRVMLSSGVFGTIRHLGERQAIIEIAPGIEMTVIKQAVVKTLKPEDDEFEYSDDDQVSDDAPAEPAFEAAEPSPFDNIQPSDFIDPKPSDVRTTDDDPTDQSSTKK